MNARCSFDVFLTDWIAKICLEALSHVISFTQVSDSPFPENASVLFLKRTREHI